jgi:hypothetical protein
MKPSLVVSSLVLLWSVTWPGAAGNAAEKSAAVKTAVAPAPPAEVARTVNAFIGRWTFETTMTPPGGKPVKFPETIDCHKGAQGRSAICVDRFTAPGEGPTEYDYLVGFDADTKIAHLFAVGSLGEVHDHRCTWSGQKVLECEPLEATLGGQPIKETFSFTFDGNKVTLRGTTVTKDGPVQFDAAGTRSVK